MQVDVQDVGLVDFPDDATDQEIQDALNELFPGQQPSTELPAALEQKPLQTGMQIIEGLNIPQTALPYNVPPSIIPDIDWQRAQQIESEPWYAGFQEGVPTSAGITPAIVPTGRKMTEAVTGIPKQAAEVLRPEVPELRALDVPMTLASSVAKTGIGLTDYLSSPQGVTELVLSMTPAKVLVLAKWAKDMAGGAYAEGAALGKLLAKENKAPEDYQQISDHTINALALGLGAGFTGKKAVTQGISDVKTIANKLNMPEGKIKLEDRGPVAQEIFNRFVTERQVQSGSPFVRAEPTPQLELPPGVQGPPQARPISMGVRTQPPLSMEFDPQGRLIGETFEPSGLELSPELQPGVRGLGIPQEIEAKITPAESEWKTVEIGRFKDEMDASRLVDKNINQRSYLKRGDDYVVFEDIPPVRQMRPIPPGFGEEISAPSIETVRAQRELEARQKGPSAIQSETAQVLRDVREPEIPQEGQVQVPVSEGRPQAAEARVEPTLESDKALYQDITSRMTQLIRSGQATSPLMEVLKGELEVVKNRHGGMPPGQTSPARQTMQAQQAAMRVELANEIHPAVRIGGRVISDPNKGHIQMALEVGGPEAISEVSKPANQGFVYKGEFISREATSELFGEKTPMTTERLKEIRAEQPKGGEPIEEAQRQKEVLEPEPEIEAVTPLDIQSGSPLSAIESLINRLEALKFPDKGEGRLYSLPHPDAVKAIGRTAWNTAIDIAIAAVKSGKAIAEAVESALAHIRKNAAGKFDEAQARANLEFVTRAEARPSLPSTEGETVQMRKSAERAATSPMVPELVQERIAGAPESFYRQQSMKRVEEVIGNLSDAELAGVSRESNLYTASKLEQARRAFDRGDNEAGYRVFEELEKEGTMMGQLINQFKLLKGTRPENIVRVINQKLKKEGKDALNEKQAVEAVKNVTKSKEKDAELDKATEAWTKNPTPENAAVAEKALLEANRSALELQRFISRYTPRSTAAIIKSVLQGNFLTPISEVANLVGNMSFLPARSMDRTVAASFDVLDNYIKGTPREITVQPIRGTVEAIKGFGRGVTKIPDIFMRGTGDVIKGETRAGLHPIDAWIKQFAKNPEMPTTGGKLTLQDRLNLAIEGTFGVPAETMLRGLGAGDVAFREAAQARATATELQLKGVPKDQWNFAQKFPELFLDDAALQRIHTDTLQAIFQRPSRTLNVITNWIRGRGEWFDLIAATVAPYKMTPWNIVGEILSYNPLIAAARSVNDFRLGNRRSAKLNAGKYVVGTMLTAAGWWLYKNGIMSPSLDQRDEAQKARILAGEVLPPNHINLSGLKRALNGGDPAFKSGDETVDVFRAGGLVGSMFYMTANIGRDFERMPEVQDSEVILAILRQSTLEQARFGMNQSFLSGVEGLLAAIREGNTDNYVRQWAGGIASVPMPNSLTVLSRATREYKPDFREDTFKKQVENIVRNKLGFANMDDYLPLKRGLWGEPLRETPEGRNALVYHFFDVFKNKQVTGDPVALELFRLWRKTTDTRVIPSLPAEKNRVLTVANKQYSLNSQQYSRYAELVGQSRRRIVDAVVVNPEFHKLPDESKITILDRIYRAGLEQGKAKFWAEAHGTLKEKPGRAGFEPGTRQ